MIRNAAYLALAFGVVNALVYLVSWIRGSSDAAFVLESLIGSAMLIWGGVRTFQSGSSRLMSAAWGLTTGALYIQIVYAYRAFSSAGAAPDYIGVYTLAALLVAVAGLCMSLANRPIE
jgi:hypothetical protein